MSRWLEQLRKVKQPGVKTVGTHNTTHRSKSMSAPPEVAAENSGRHIADAENTDTLPHLPWQLERLLSAAGSSVLEIELPGVQDVTRYTMAWGCAYLTGDRDEALRRLWQVYRAWEGVK